MNKLCVQWLPIKHTDAKHDMCKVYNITSSTLNNKIMEIQN